MEFDFSSCDKELTQKRINEIKHRCNMIVALDDLFDKPCEWRFLNSFDDSKILDFALFYLRKEIENCIEKYDVNDVVEKITMIGD